MERLPPAAPPVVFPAPVTEPGAFTGEVRSPAVVGLPRLRLERRLCGPGAAGIGLVLGPPGSGKTTLLSRVAGARTSAWYRASPEDSAEDALVRQLARALAPAVPGAALPVPGGELADLLSALHDGPSADVWLVVDDLHELAATPAESALERLAALRPPWLRIVLGSRRPPQMNVPRWLVSGELGLLEADDLRFRSWEVEELFREVYERPLAPETAAALTRRTGGWAAGLRLFHLATAALDPLERERAVADLSGRSRLIRSYLTRNVVEGLSEDRRDFLLRTCTLGVLTGDACDELLGTTGSAAVLADLEAQQFFTSSGDDGRTYRYHQVLQAHLEVLLVDELGSAAARRLYSRSGELLERAGLVAAAVRAHARAEDWGAVARLVPRGAPGPELTEQGSRLDLPRLSSDDPALAVAQARRLARNGQLEESVRAFLLAESELDDPEFRLRCELERSMIAQWLPEPPPLRGRVVAEDQALQLSAELRLSTRSVLDPLGSTSALARAAALLLAGDRPAAADELRRSMTLGGGTTVERLSTRLLTVVAELPGGADVAGALEQIVLDADLEGVPWLARLARGLQAAALIVVDPRRWRGPAAAQLVEECCDLGDHWSACLLGLALGAACVLAGERGSATRLLERAARGSRDLRAPVLEVWAEGLSRLATGAGEGDAGPELDGLGSRAERLGVQLRGVLSAFEPSPDPVPAVHPSTPAPQVVLECLGHFALTVDGVAVPAAELRPRVRSLLWVLAVHCGEPVHREQLIAWLWPEATLAAGLRSLQVAVSSLRQLAHDVGLAGGAVARRGEAYLLALPTATVGHLDFEAAARRAARLEPRGRDPELLSAWLAALDRYAGDLVPEAGPAEWVVPERDRLRLVAARAGSRAAHTALRVGEWEAGVRAARRSLELDPYDDTVWQVLTELLQRTGRVSAAAMARRDHQRLMADLGV